MAGFEQFNVGDWVASKDSGKTRIGQVCGDASLAAQDPAFLLTGSQVSLLVEWKGGFVLEPEMRGWVQIGCLRRASPLEVLAVAEIYNPHEASDESTTRTGPVTS